MNPYYYWRLWSYSLQMKYIYIWKEQQENLVSVFQNSPDCVAVEHWFSLTLWSVQAVVIFQGKTPAINWWTAVCVSNCHWGHAGAKTSLMWQECACKCITEMRTLSPYIVVFADSFLQKASPSRKERYWTLCNGYCHLVVH